MKLARFAEGLGYDSLWTSDHFIPSTFADQRRPVLEGWAALAGLAALTSRASCGIMVTGNTYRNPAHLAKIAATVDHISGGRLIVGIGAGWLEEEHGMYGFPFPDKTERVHRMGEAIQIMQQLWTQDRASFKGKYYQVTEAICEPKPVRKPHPPIWVGSGGVQLGMRYVARLCRWLERHRASRRGEGEDRASRALLRGSRARFRPDRKIDTVPEALSLGRPEASR